MTMSEKPSFSPEIVERDIVGPSDGTSRREFRDPVESPEEVGVALDKFNKSLERISRQDNLEEWDRGKQFAGTLLRLMERVKSPAVLRPAHSKFLTAVSRYGNEAKAGNVFRGVLTEFALADVLREVHRLKSQFEIYYPLDREDTHHGVDWWFYDRRSDDLAKNRALAIQVKSARSDGLEGQAQDSPAVVALNSPVWQELPPDHVAARLNRDLNLVAGIDGRAVQKVSWTASQYENVAPVLVIIPHENSPIVDEESGKFIDQSYARRLMVEIVGILVK